MEAAIPVKERIIKSVNVPINILPELQQADNRIISYISKEGKTLAIYNSAYVFTLSHTIDKLAEYWIHFQGILSINSEVIIYINKYEELIKNTSELVNRINRYLNPEIAKWEMTLMEGEAKMRKYLEENQNKVVDLKTLTENTNFILKSMKDKEKLLTKLRSDGDKESMEAKEVAAIEAESEGAKEILQSLRLLKKKIDEDELYSIEKEYSESRENYNRLINYMQEIKKVKILINNPELIDINEVNTHANSMFLFFEDFSKNYQELSNIYEEFKTRDMCLSKIKEKWQLHENYRFTKVLNGFIEAEREYWFSKRNGAENRLTLYDTNDRSKHLNSTFKNIQENLQNFNKDINSFNLVGDIHYETNPVTQTHYCKDEFHTVEYTEFHSIWHDYNLIKNVSDKNIVDPQHYVEGIKTIEYKKVIVEMNLNFEVVDKKYQENLVILKYYEDLKVEIDNYFTQIGIKNHEVFNELSRKQIVFKEFYSKMNLKSYVIDEAFINTLIGAVISRINLRLKPGCCSFKPSLFSVTNLNPVDFYSIFLSILLENKRKVKGCCGRSKVDRVHSCEEISLEDIKVLLITPEVLVSLKSSTGHNQILRGEALIEDCLFSIDQVIKKTVKLISLRQNFKSKLANKRAEKFIKKYQDNLSNILKRNKYKGLEENVSKYKFKLETN